MVDAAVLARAASRLGPGIQQVCALGSTASCSAAHAGVGCVDPNVVQCVCLTLPTCCTVSWDATCVARAATPACLSSAVFVSANSGDDANPGTLGLPVRSIARGIQVADQQSDSLVMVQAGTYVELVAPMMFSKPSPKSCCHGEL